MGTAFHWFYCLDIPDVLLLSILGITAFRVLDHRFRTRPWWTAILAAGGLLWLATVLYQTLFSRIPGTRQAFLPPLASYREVLSGGQRELLRSNLMNGLLFVPSGLLGSALLPDSVPRPKRIGLIAAVALILSLSIELLQYTQMLGVAESDDVIHNVLGAALAAALWCIPHRRSNDHDPN